MSIILMEYDTSMKMNDNNMLINLGEFQKYNVEWKKPDRKVDDPIYIYSSLPGETKLFC
jgi:hypothetical protein